MSNIIKIAHDYYIRYNYDLVYVSYINTHRYTNIFTYLEHQSKYYKGIPLNRNYAYFFSGV